MVSFKSVVSSLVISIISVTVLLPVHAQIGDGAEKFKQLHEELPTPNVYRGANGAPGPNYWQQQADYKIVAALDEEKRRISGYERITYTNNAPQPLKYIWVQLDQNRFKNDSLARRSETASTAQSRRASGGDGDSVSYNGLARHYALKDIEHGFEINSVLDETGKALPHTIVDTMMRIDLPAPLESGNAFVFDIDWSYNLIDEAIIGGRGGFERFRANEDKGEERDTYIYFMAQWFPRVAAFTDYEGWANKAFLGRGEFTLEFGDYDVSLTVPSDHIVSSTGVLENPREVLTATQRSRLRKAEDSDKPLFIVTAEEAAKNEKEAANDTKTWKFKAENVRDFAWASSRKFIWDAMGHKQDDEDVPLVMAMSFYPNEAEPIWSQYSTEAVVHTMDVYSKYSFAYPYPTAQSVNTWERGGMEYPMITFNGYRPTRDIQDDDGNFIDPTYSRNTKYGLIGVIIHEIGHIYFPMIVNSDERQWTWMDEGLNTFLEYVAEVEWEENYPAFRGKVNLLDYITTYMKSSDQVPIMTQSDSILQFGPNAYSKPASALLVLRETVMGRELFDFAFREYAQRWKFKRPTPSDFFRTMEDASGVDLDWFWRGWFYSTDHVNIAVNDVREYRVSSQDPDKEFPLDRRDNVRDFPEPVQQSRNRDEDITPRYQRREELLKDFYNENDPFTVTNKDRNEYKEFRDGLDPWESETLERALDEKPYIYFVDFQNKGGLVMPLPLTLTYHNGNTEEMMIPAEIWRRDASGVTKLFILDKPLASISIDDQHQIADVDRSDNHFPRQIAKSRLELYKSKNNAKDMMADALVELKSEDKGTGSDENKVPLTQSE